MAKTAKKVKEPDADLDLARLIDLMEEQIPAAEDRARADLRTKTSATWVARGDHLVLLIVNAVDPRKIRRKSYRCRILEVAEDV